MLVRMWHGSTHSQVLCRQRLDISFAYENRKREKYKNYKLKHFLLQNHQYLVFLFMSSSFLTGDSKTSPFYFPFIIWRERKYSKSDPNSQPWNLQHGLNLTPAHPFVPNCPKWGSFMLHRPGRHELMEPEMKYVANMHGNEVARSNLRCQSRSNDNWIVCFECFFFYKSL